MPQIVKNALENSPLILFLAALVAAPFVISNQYVLQIMIFIGIYVILAQSLNLLNGYIGLIAIGHAGFYGIGAYTSAMLTVDMGAPFEVAFLAAGLVAGAFGWALGRPTLRLEGIYLALATLGFNIIVWLVLLNWNGFTGGPLGIKDIPRPSVFGWEVDTRIENYFFVLAVVAVVVFTMARLVNSRFGRALVAIREDQLAAAAMGVNVTRYKVQAFVISAFYAGIAGACYAHSVRYISPDSFTMLESFILLAILALGGSGNMIGPIVGAAILIAIPELFRAVSEYRMLLYGLVLIIVMQVRPQGLFGGHHYDLRLRLFDRRQRKAYRGDVFLPPEAM
ncbi:MAG: branched-chain amino acid ABC transporter permease [Bauldia sp.]|uniref:branched-chain amino acid ABC transporter permease n=1 Tax=Bauldia sp. TaxID=2575872 RepID=UPI001D36C435|nr:branched-chain amino acid ABC transporter permease [Bauldia sp.]MCB1496551.1 branched-chain amino acid ABC transporter permease [Bauldia sp.]